jgi:hypothetical protein
MLLILLFNTIPLFVSWSTTTYSCPIITVYKSMLAILISPTNPKVITVISTALGTILFNLMFFILL